MQIRLTDSQPQHDRIPAPCSDYLENIFYHIRQSTIQSKYRYRVREGALVDDLLGTSVKIWLSEDACQIPQKIKEKKVHGQKSSEITSVQGTIVCRAQITSMVEYCVGAYRKCVEF